MKFRHNSIHLSTWYGDGQQACQCDGGLQMTVLAGHAEPAAHIPVAVGCSITCIHVPKHSPKFLFAEEMNGLLPCPRHATKQGLLLRPVP
jgi:hypothetical protein